MLKAGTYKTIDGKVAHVLGEYPGDDTPWRGFVVTTGGYVTERWSVLGVSSNPENKLIIPEQEQRSEKV